MKKLIVLAAGVLAGHVCLTGCKTPTARVAALPLEYPGFQTYPTPRTFDGPGTLFRIDKGNKKFPTANLSVSVTNVGQESFPTVNRNKTWELSLLAKFLGKTDASVTGDSKSKLVLDVDLGPGTRFRTFDQEIDEAISAAHIQYKADNRYYVIRETIAFQKVDFDLSRSNSITAEAKVSLKKLADSSGKAAHIYSSDTKLSQKWEQPHHVFFIADEIVPPGKGLFGSKPKRLPVTERILIQDEAN